MSKPKVTIQDIADSLKLSRNTVSKALNGNENIAEETRKKVIEEAIKLKYKHFAFMNTENLTAQKKGGNIALFTSHLPTGPHFGSMLLSELEKKISAEGYNLSIHILRDTEINALTLPNNFELKSVDGIVCIEQFDKKYSQLISSLGIPTIFIDCTADMSYNELNADILLMENMHSTYSVTKKLIENGYNKIGFIGDYNHCKSFNERWIGFNKALSDFNIKLNLSYCILDSDQYPYNDFNWIKSKLDNMKNLPSAFIYANDFIAISTMKALKDKNITIPDEIAICGFDDSPEASIVDPSLTTVHIFSSDMGIIAAEMLLSRLKNPSKPYQITHVKTNPIYRKSTNIKIY